MQACCVAALVLLPESPRWLVVQGKLDEALAVMHRILTNARLPQGEFPGGSGRVDGAKLLCLTSLSKDAGVAACACERVPALPRKPLACGRRCAGVHSRGGG